MSTLREVLNRLNGALVTVEEAEDGRLRLRTWLEEYPITPELTDLCREHKSLLLEYVRWETEADKLLIDSANRLARMWPHGCKEAELELDLTWADLERRIHEAYSEMDRAALMSAIETREAHALVLFRSRENEVATENWAADVISGGDAIDSMIERELEPTFKASQLPGMIVDEDGHKLSGSDDEIQAEVIAEFRETGTMSGYFFAEPLPGQSERPDESWTWGPAVSDIDWEA